MLLRRLKNVSLDHFEVTATLIQHKKRKRRRFCLITNVTQTLVIRDQHLGNRKMTVEVGDFYFDGQMVQGHQTNYDNNEMPHEYVPLMVDPKTSKAAIAFYMKLREQNFINKTFNKHFLLLATKKGFERAERSLDKLLAKKPIKGEITIMADLELNQGPH